MAVNAACSCHQHLKIHTPRVLGVGVGNVQAIRHVTIVMIGHWSSGSLTIRGLLMPNAIDPLVAMLATPLVQSPIPHLLRLPSR